MRFLFRSIGFFTTLVSISLFATETTISFHASSLTEIIFLHELVNIGQRVSKQLGTHGTFEVFDTYNGLQRCHEASAIFLAEWMEMQPHRQTETFEIYKREHALIWELVATEAVLPKLTREIESYRKRNAPKESGKIYIWEPTIGFAYLCCYIFLQRYITHEELEEATTHLQTSSGIRTRNLIDITTRLQPQFASLISEISRSKADKYISRIRQFMALYAEGKKRKALRNQVGEKLESYAIHKRLFEKGTYLKVA